MLGKVSIVVVTWNSGEFIGDCLESINKRSIIEKEIIVVDNHSTDDTVAIVKSQFPHVILIENQENYGFTFATNQGIENSSGNFVLLLNPDTVMKNDAIEQLINYLFENPEVGCVAPQLLNFDDSIQQSCRSFPSQQNYFWEFTGLSRLFPKHKVFSQWKMGYFSHDELREVDQPMGACMMLTRKALDSIGLLDNDFYMFYSEVDLCYRLVEKGWKIIFYPDAKVYHHIGASVKKAKKKMILSTHKSAYDFLRKHKVGSRFTLPIIGFFIYLSAYLRIFKQVILKIDEGSI